MSYKNANNLLGWVAFLVAAVTYILTIEPTASFWDCGEFIAVSYKLMVPHPPGAPLFLLIGRAFSLMAGGDVTQVAFWINMVSAMSSAFTILFLFWTITLLGKKMLVGRGIEHKLTSAGQQALVLGSGLVGALAFTFSDSFWFSAVEAEVYALSSFFTAFVFWAMLRWDEVADQPRSDRWLLLIAYAMGLSIGVHLLNLVTIPAMALVYYFRRSKEIKPFSLIVTIGISFMILGVILVGIIPGLPSLAGSFEVFFVNSLKLPFGSGLIFFGILFLAALSFGVIYSIKKNNYILNTSLLALIFVLIGYSSYGIIVIRSNFNPPIDENDPENVISMVSYLKREQYGDRPLVYGPLYTAKVVKQEKGAPIYAKRNGKYEVVDHKTVNEFDPKHKTLFPRIYSTREDHIRAYGNYVTLPSGGRKPTMVDNLGYYFKGQLGHFYWRYFMWNFSGKASDMQDAKALTPFNVEADSDLPETISENKARNNFWALPLILGLGGFIFHISRAKRDSIVVTLLFVFTGLAIITYLNTPPIEPRERDYAYVGSYYTFCIWIGLGVMALADLLSKAVKNGVAQAGLSTVICLGVPLIMAIEGWDDHDRSNRFHSVDSAKNLLESCEPNAIIFTGGDNDTFPLWYVQEVEGYRTDVRVCNLSLLGTDWYINQMKQKAYESEPLPITLEKDNFIQGTNDYLPFVEQAQVKNGMNLMQYINLVKQENQALMLPTQSGSMLTILPTRKLVLNYEPQAVAQNQKLSSQEASQIIPSLKWNLSKSNLYKNDLIVLDILATNAADGWKRPIYFSTTLGGSNYMGLNEYFQLEGLAYRFLPIRHAGQREGIVDTDQSYDKLINKFHYRELNNPDVFYDENYRRFSLNLRKSFHRLAQQLYQEGKKDKAKEVIKFCFEKMPDESIPFDFYVPLFIPLMNELGMIEEANQVVDIMGNRAVEEIDYYLKQNPRNSMELQMNMSIIQQLYTSLRQMGQEEKAKEYEQKFQTYYPRVFTQ